MKKIPFCHEFTSKNIDFTERRRVFFSDTTSTENTAHSEYQISDNVRFGADKIFIESVKGHELDRINYVANQEYAPFALEILNTNVAVRNEIQRLYGKDNVLDAVATEAIKQAIEKKMAEEAQSKSLGAKARNVLSGIPTPFRTAKKDRSLETEAQEILKNIGKGKGKTDIDTARYREIYVKQVVAIEKIRLYSVQNLEKKYKPDLTGLDATVKNNLEQLTDFGELQDTWQNNPAMRVLLGRLESPKYQSYLSELTTTRSLTNPFSSDFQKAEKAYLNTPHSGQTSLKEAYIVKNAEFKEAQSALEKAKKIEAEKKQIAALLKERKKLDDQKTKITEALDVNKDGSLAKAKEQALADLNTSSTSKNRSYLQAEFDRARAKVDEWQEKEESNNDALDANEERLLESAGHFSGINYKNPKTGAQIQILDFKDISDIEAAMAANGSIINFGIAEMRTEVRDKEQKAQAAEKEFKAVEAQHDVVKNAYERSKQKFDEAETTNLREKAEGTKKRSPEDLLIDLFTLQYQKEREVNDPDRAKKLAHTSVNLEINEVENNTLQERLTENARNAMQRRGWKNTWVGSAVRGVQNAPKAIKEWYKDGGVTSKVARGAVGIVGQVLGDVFMPGRRKNKKDGAH